GKLRVGAAGRRHHPAANVNRPAAYWRLASRAEDGWAMIAVAIVAAIRLYREGLARALTRVEGIQVVAAVADSDELRGRAAETVDIVLLDMGGSAGLDAIRAARAAKPEAAVV